MEVKTQICRIHYLCDECKEGFLAVRNTEAVDMLICMMEGNYEETSHRHVCNKCGHEKVLDKIYPYEKEEIAW